jgi:hypothetical protein
MSSRRGKIAKPNNRQENWQIQAKWQRRAKKNLEE